MLRFVKGKCNFVSHISSIIKIKGPLVELKESLFREGICDSPKVCCSIYYNSDIINVINGYFLLQTKCQWLHILGISVRYDYHIF